MKIRSVPLSEVSTTKGQSLLASDYLESDLASVKRQLRARYPNKNVRVEIRRDGRFYVSITETVHVALVDGIVQQVKP